MEMNMMQQIFQQKMLARQMYEQRLNENHKKYLSYLYNNSQVINPADISDSEYEM